ncbi:MAG: ribonuclease J [Myxococcota bacterium]
MNQSPPRDPPTVSSERLRMGIEVVPLGGLGEVGMNCMTLAHGDDVLVLDCGVTFPGRVHGVDLDHPRFDHIVAERDRLRGIVITHGHEDHIGALPYLVRTLLEAGAPLPPMWAPPYAIALIRHRFEEHADLPKPTLHAFHVGERVSIGAWEVEPVRVNHSIPDSLALVLRSPGGTVVHSGDFKIEDRPVDGEAFGRDALRAAAEEGVALLMSDSTNVDVPGESGEEADVAEALGAIVGAARGRVVIAQFASNVYRIQAAFGLAERYGRRVVLLGRSVQMHARIARDLGMLPGAGTRLVEPEEAQRVPRDQLMVLATGTQGEWPAALPRLARRDHQHLALDPGDEVVFSSRIIPGHEQVVHDVVCNLERQGVVVHERRGAPGVHVSGHACQGEQRTLIELVKPRGFVPVHGTFHHLKKHGALARDAGVEDVLVVENGTRIGVLPDGLAAVGQVESGRVHVDRGRPVDDEALRERRWLGESGVVVVAMAVSPELRIVGDIDLTARGLPEAVGTDTVLDEAAEVVRAEMKRFARDIRDVDDMEDQARRSLRRFFAKGHNYRTQVVAMAVPVSAGRGR